MQYCFKLVYSVCGENNANFVSNQGNSAVAGLRVVFGYLSSVRQIAVLFCLLRESESEGDRHPLAGVKEEKGWRTGA